MTEFMRNSDAFAWEMEHDPSLRSTIVTILLLDRSPGWDVLVERCDRIGRLVPMFRQRVVDTLPPAPPRWEYDPPDFDVFHECLVEGFDEVLALAAPVESLAH